MSASLLSAGIVLVTTPQKTAIQVARRGANMFEKLQVPLIGLVVNMGAAVCPECKASVPVFGRDTAAYLSAELGKCSHNEYRATL